MRTALLLAGSLVLAGCGGKVVVDGPGDPGAGGGTSASSASASASSSATSASSSTGGACPDFPLIAGPCSIPVQVCPVPFGCCNGDAICGPGNVWVYKSFGCGEACIDCGGGLGCTGGSICVDYQADFTESFGCRKDPCPGSTDCACIQSICQESSLSCQSHEPTKLICDCPTC